MRIFRKNICFLVTQIDESAFQRCENISIDKKSIEPQINEKSKRTCKQSTQKIKSIPPHLQSSDKTKSKIHKVPKP